ncbi:hypothetical protein JGU40_13485, partial [Staphylococcus aureus]|uniref:hypothetical protein n=1 Tax=Staphylococcus aureus TaxID=1280 RepID=UPI0018EB83C9
MKNIYSVNLPHIRGDLKELTNKNIEKYYHEGMITANYLKQYKPETLCIEWDKDKSEDFINDIQLIKHNKHLNYYTEFHFVSIPLSSILNINIYCIDQNDKEERKKLQKCAEKILE